MPQVTCHDTFANAQLKRRPYPLKAGAYKLREARHRLLRMMETVDAISDYLREPNSLMKGAALGPCCTKDDKACWLRNLPKQVADMLGYDIQPSIAALTGDGIAEKMVLAELAGARARVDQLLVDCEAQRTRLKGKGKSEYGAIKSGQTDLYDLLVGADRIAEHALQLGRRLAP